MRPKLQGAHGGVLARGLVVVHVEAQDVFVLDGVGDGVGVQLPLEEVGGGAEGFLLAGDLHARGVGLEDVGGPVECQAV